MASDIDDSRLATAGGIKYRILQGYPKLGQDEKKGFGTEQYVLRAANIPAFFVECFPPAIVIGNIVSQPPRRRMPGMPALITMRLNAEPFSGEKPGDPFLQDTEAPTKTYDDLYRVTIDYETGAEKEEEDQENQEPEEFLEQSVSAGGEFITFSPRKTTTSLEADDISPGELSPAELAARTLVDLNTPIIKYSPLVEHSLKWKRVQFPWWDKIFATLGRVNDRRMKVFFNTPADTVLFTGVSATRQYFPTWTGTGTVLTASYWEIAFKFSQRYRKEGPVWITWNHIFCPNEKHFRRVKFDDGGRSLYERADFRDLFKSDPSPDF